MITALLLTLATLPAPKPVLWYDKPTTDYMSGLPVGNGRIGAMVLGEPGRQRIALNDLALWRHKTAGRTNADDTKGLAEFRRLMMEGKTVEANRRAPELLGWKYVGVDPYQPVGDLWIDLPGVKEATDYRRSLDLSTGVVTTRFRAGGVGYTCQVFASRADDVIVARVAADRPGALQAEFRLSRKPDPECTITRLTDWGGAERFAIAGEFPEHVGFAADALMTRTGGSIAPVPHDASRIGDQTGVEKANAVTVVVGIGAGEDALKAQEDALSSREAARKRSFAQLLARHVAAHRRLYDRVKLRLGRDDRADVPTDRRLADLRAGRPDPSLEALYFDYGRYLLMSSSSDKPGSLPANLQGLWCEDMHPAWDADYHTNINLQMNYWPADVANLDECAGPLFDYVDRLAANGREAAKSLYGCDGTWVAQSSDRWAGDHKQNGPWTEWVGAAPWLAQHYWWHWEYTGDRAFLRERAYPFMKEAARFFESYLVPDARADSKWKGRLVTVPSYSPENSFLVDGQRCSLCVGATMDLELIRDLLTHCIAASEALGVDADRRAQWRSILDRLPPLQVGKYGQLQEWLEDYDEAEPGHRHMSHLFALFPGDQITVEDTPELARAARVSLERRLSHEGGHTGWSRSWTVGLWARLHEGDKAEEHLRHLIGDFATISLLDLHPPRIFQIDGNFGGTTGMAEMLMQSHRGVIRLLPALPKAWLEGEVSGLMARGGVEVGIAWSNGRASTATLRSRRGGEVRLRPPVGQRIVAATAAGRPIALHPVPGTADVTLRCPAGKTVRIRLQ